SAAAASPGLDLDPSAAPVAQAPPLLLRPPFDPHLDLGRMVLCLGNEALLHSRAALGAGLAHSRHPRSTVSSLRFQASKSSLPKSAVNILSRSRWCTSITSGGTRIGLPRAAVLTWISQARCSM